MDPATGGAPPPPPEVNIYQVKLDPQFSGKTVIVSGKVLQTFMLQKEMILVLEGNLRCRLKHHLSPAKQQTILNTQVKILGVVVPRAEVLATSSPHMIDCTLHGS